MSKKTKQKKKQKKNRTANNHRDNNGQFTQGNQSGFKKGKSGNPKGRPSLGKCLTDALRKKLKEKTKIKGKSMTYYEIIAETTLRLAMKGNSVALHEIWDRIDGKVPQPIGIGVSEQTKEAVDKVCAILNGEFEKGKDAKQKQ